jgi:hypothetical protein
MAKETQKLPPLEKKKSTLGSKADSKVIKKNSTK